MKMHKEIKAGELVPGMVLARCVVGHNGNIILSEGAMVTEAIIRRLFTWDIDRVWIECAESDMSD